MLLKLVDMITLTVKQIFIGSLVIDVVGRYDEELASQDGVDRDSRSRTGQVAVSRPGKDGKTKPATWK